jgi:hypothetical protein
MSAALVPCGELHSITAGDYSFTVNVKFNNVRAYRCVMDIPIAFVPATGTRYGPLSGARCENDGLGCIKLTKVVNVTLDSDIPTYERKIKRHTIRSQFDDNGQSVPFVTAGAQVLDQLNSAGLPYADWIPGLTKFLPRVNNPLGGRSLANMNTDMIISVFTRQSANETGADHSIFPHVVASDMTLLPSFTPFEISAFVERGGRMYPGTAIRSVGNRLAPFGNTTMYSPAPLRAISPNYKNLMLGGAFMAITMERIIALGHNTSEAALILSDMYNESLPLPSFFAEKIDPLIDGVPMSELDNATLAASIFQTTKMFIEFQNVRTLACMSETDWVAVLGDNASSWSPVGCTGSAQCSMAGITIDKRKVLRRSIPYMLSSSNPTCDTYIPVMPVTEKATIKLGMAVTIDGVQEISMIRTVTLSPKDEVHTEIHGQVVLSVVTHESSVRRLLSEPAELVYLLNCFSMRQQTTNDTVTVNPFISLPEGATLSVIESQRGVLILPNTHSDIHLGSGCGSMNPGMGIWRQVANKVPSVFYNPGSGGVDADISNPLRNRISFQNVMNAFHRTGHSCAGGGACHTKTPCNLFSDEMTWLRKQGVLPRYYEPFDPNAPDLNTGTVQFFNTSLESPSVPIVNQIPNIQVKERIPRAGCGSAGGIPMSLGSTLWRPKRMNMWVKSNRMGSPDDQTMYIEDTHTHDYKKISHGVSYNAVAEIPWASVPHERIFNNTAEGCVYMPITTFVSSPQLACVQANPKLAGTVAATIEFEAGETERELNLFVECIGFAFCPIWNASAVTLTDIDTGLAVPYTPVVGSAFNALSSVGVERYVTERLGSVVGQYNESLLLTQLYEYARYGQDLTEHISIRFNQTKKTGRYVWEITGSPNISIALADEYGAVYFAQLYQNGLAVAISDLQEFSCLSLTKCTLRKDIPALCKPPNYNTVPNITFVQVYNDTSCKCAIYNVPCQYNCGQNFWLYFMPMFTAIAGIIFLTVYYERMGAKEATTKKSFA